MASLRETKKEATRRALADAAARLALSCGSDAVTVGAIAKAAGVSARTFHNYFTSAADALLYFTADVLEQFSAEVPDLFPEARGVTELFESIVLDSLGDQQAQLHSLTSLFRVGEALENLSTSSEEKKKYEAVAHGVLDSFHARFPARDSFEVAVLLQASAGAAIVALKECNTHQLTNDSVGAEELVKRAFSALRTVPPAP
ncbi:MULTISPECIES: TetR/AcrR family transcriptional regulator [unclassified Corynebacterium]|uniref:TetR/AcrR family transcriptional regulator n=1 Tax=unclassified Corynebacterium TaxID=2624378 RepID=UPI0008A64B7F|nr:MULTISPECIES: TetR family transcriptional regulator [unclassified Corynebacterium]MCQ9675820.1 TetR/AcrR family transcriptional regulator [Corynebacterium sp. BF-R-2]OFT62352.1 hypothetical protein HMPREF3149_03805 [Corynebacterium sp. HMSC05E07]